MRLLISLFIVIAGISGCEKEDVTIDPKVAILGKWEITHTSFGPVENPLVYEEYLTDSILLVYNYEEETFSKEKYWFSDSLLYKRRVYIEATTNDTLFILIEPFRYKFLDHNKLRLEFQYSAVNTTFTYKRIK